MRKPRNKRFKSWEGYVGIGCCLYGNETKVAHIGPVKFSNSKTVRAFAAKLNQIAAWMEAGK